MSNIQYWKNEWDSVASKEELSQHPDKKKQNLPDGVFEVKDVEESVKNGSLEPSVYFVNLSNDVAFVLKEDAEYPTRINPGQLYIYSVEGAATPSFGVYKIKNFGSIYADIDETIKPHGVISGFWGIISNDTGYKDENWIKEREKQNDMKWVRLYNSVK